MVTPAQSRGIPKSPPRTKPVGQDAKANGYGLRRGVLSPMETLAQSISTVAPTLTPVATIPLVAALAGNGTWLAYVLATVAILLVAWCIGRFARYSSSPGSLYSYVDDDPAAMARGNGGVESVAGLRGHGREQYRRFLSLREHHASGRHRPCRFRRAACGDFHRRSRVDRLARRKNLGARRCSSIEVVSVTLHRHRVWRWCWSRHGLHGDPNQLHLRGVTGSGFRLGLVLAMFSFVGFESATTLGSEARNPLKTIPRAVILTAFLGGVFFTICAYTEILGFGMGGQDLGTTDAPMHVLASVGGMPVLGLLIDLGALVSLVRGESRLHHRRCARAAADVAQRTDARFTPSPRTRETKRPPARSSPRVSRRFFLWPSLPREATSGLDVYGWLGSLATYGFIVTMGWSALRFRAICAITTAWSTPRRRPSPGSGASPWCYALVANLYPVPEGPYGKLPYIFLAYLFVVLVWFVFRLAR